jgi:hypothetical protein
MTRHSPGHWADRKNQMRVMVKLRLKKFWFRKKCLYKISKDAINNAAGTPTMLKGYFGNSPTKFVKKMYPDHPWKEYKFKNTKLNYWKKESGNWPEYFKGLCENYCWLDDNGKPDQDKLYSGISNDNINNYYGSTLRRYITPIEFVKEMCPELDFKDYKFKKTPDGWWNKRANKENYFKDLCEKEGWSEPEHYYNITAEKLRGFYGGQLLEEEHYKGSPQKFVMDMCVYDWKFYRFNVSKNEGWEDKNKQKEWFDDYCKSHSIDLEGGDKEIEKLYSITNEKVKDFDGSGLLALYGNSPSELVKNLVEYEWVDYKFSRTPTNYWLKVENHKKYFDDLCEKYNLVKKEDFYNLTEDLIHHFHGNSLLTIYYNSSPKKLVMMNCHKFDDWDEARFDKGRKTQKLMYDLILRNYSDARWEYQFNFKFKKSGRKIGADVYIPSKKLAIEGQGFQHYGYIDGFWGGEKGFKEIVMRDKEKMRKIKKHGMRLLIIPFCEDDPKLAKWGGDWESLVNIAKEQGIDL